MEGIPHAFFTRRGGFSEGVYASLNVGLGSKDDPLAVRENRRRCAAHFGAETLVTAYQVHSALAVVADGPWNGEPPHADAVVTATPGVVVGVLSADCAPILLADPKARVVAAAHAGWKGALGGVIDSTLTEMERLGADRARIFAAVGPCIGPDSYEVGPEFLDRFIEVDPSFRRYFRAADGDGKSMFDLPGFVMDRLFAAGVMFRESVHCDTCAQAEDFFSNRRAFKAGEPDYGRLLSAIMISA
jgi:hypothetical protein